MRAVDFAEHYGIEAAAVAQFAFNNKGESFIRKDGRAMFVDRDYLEEYHRDIKHMWNVSHEYYYYLLERLDIKQSGLAVLLDADYPDIAWMQWFSQGMWSRVDDRSILSIHISNNTLTVFIGWCEVVIPQIEYRLKIKDIT